MTWQQAKIIGVAGTNYFVYADDARAEAVLVQEAVLKAAKAGYQITGVIRAVLTQNMGQEGAVLLATEPAAKWFLDQYDTAGRQIKLSGGGVIALTHFLLETGMQKLRDRRQTVPIATRAGVRDTLVGVASISTDLGKWRYINLGPAKKQMQLELGSHHEVVLAVADSLTAKETEQLKMFEPGQTASATLRTVATVSKNPVADGLGRVAAQTYDQAGTELASSTTAAVAAALTARYFTAVATSDEAKGLAHHWRVEMPGGGIAVRMFATEEGEHVSVSAPAETICDF